MGQDIIIPDWVWGMFTLAIVVWLVRITFMVFSAKEEIRAQKERDNGVTEKLVNLEDKIDDTKNDLHGAMDKLEKRFDKTDSKVDEIFRLLIKATK
jgi:hypothetical protein